jgi:uncharacterized membrane protein
MMKLKGGVASSISGYQVFSIVVILLIAHIVLSILMWSNVIQFANTDSKLATAIPLTVIGVLLLFYMMAIGFTTPIQD